MKPIITIQGRTDSRRECLPLRDMTDCLLQAYDCVARRAYKKFLRRGGVSGGELDDWLNAEHELLGNLPVDVEDSGTFVSALASLPGFTSEDVDVGIDPRWLIILGRRTAADGIAELDDCRMDEEQIAEWASAIHTDARTLRVRARCARDSMARRREETSRAHVNQHGGRITEISDSPGPANAGRTAETGVQAASGNNEQDKISWIAGEIEGRAENSGDSVREPDEQTAPSQVFCILELPTEVDPARCVAVLANGLLGIRMPKRTDQRAV
jgi:HSP20 family molecular chaperone IbpA